MSKTNADVKVTDESTETPPEGTEETTTGTETDESTETKETTDEESEETEDEDKDDKDDELPEWARKKLSKANTEAGKYRTQLRELQAKFEGAKTPEEFAAATQELGETNAKLDRELAVERALRKHNLGDEDALFLTATSPEEIAKQAEALAARVGSGIKRLTGGLDPTDEDEGPGDPASLAKSLRKKRF